jgi:hypothetical protein
MRPKWLGILLLLFGVPLIAVAQEYPERPRGEIQIINDWKRPVRINLWTNGGEQVSQRRWTLVPGQSEFLGNESGKRIRVRGSDKISIGKGEQVDVEQVAQFQGGLWYVSVREMLRATHHRPGLPPDQGNAYPPDQRPGLPPDQGNAAPPDQRSGFPPDAPSAGQRY